VTHAERSPLTCYASRVLALITKGSLAGPRSSGVSMLLPRGLRARRTPPDSSLLALPATGPEPPLLAAPRAAYQRRTLRSPGRIDEAVVVRPCRRALISAATITTRARSPPPGGARACCSNTPGGTKTLSRRAALRRVVVSFTRTPYPDQAWSRLLRLLPAHALPNSLALAAKLSPCARATASPIGSKIPSCRAFDPLRGPSSTMPSPTASRRHTYPKPHQPRQPSPRATFFGEPPNEDCTGRLPPYTTRRRRRTSPTALLRGSGRRSPLRLGARVPIPQRAWALASNTVQTERYRGYRGQTRARSQG